MVRDHRNQSRNRTLEGKSGLKSDVLSEIRNQPSLEIIAESAWKSVFEISKSRTPKWIVADPSAMHDSDLVLMQILPAIVIY